MKTVALFLPRFPVLLSAGALALLAGVPAAALAQAEGSGVVSPTPAVAPTGTSTVQEVAPRDASVSAAPTARRGRLRTARRSRTGTPPPSTGPDAPPSARADARNRMPMPTARDPGAGLGTGVPQPPR